MSQDNRQKKSKGPGFGRGPVEKPKNFKLSLLKLAAYIKRYNVAIIISIIAAIIGTVLQIIGPDKIKQLTNEIMKGLPALVDGQPILIGIDMSAVSKIAWVLVLFYVTSGILNLIQSHIMAVVTQKISKTMRTDIAEKINLLPLKYFDTTSHGDILSRVTNDVDIIGQTLNQSISSLVSSVTMLIGTLVMMLYNSWVLTLTAVGASLIGFVIMTGIIKKSQKYFVAQQENLGDINGHIEEVYSGHNVVRAYNAQAQTELVFDGINQKLYDSAWKSQFLSGLMMPIMQFIGNFGYVAVCVVGAALAMKGSIEFGVIVAFMIYVRLFTQPLTQIAQAANNLQRASAAGERVFEFLEQPELEDESHKQTLLEDITGNVRFENVKFGYNPDRTIIHNFSAQALPGQKIAIVGPTGAGKTTIVNLLMRFYELDEGNIYLDGTAISSVPRENVHDKFCMVLQDSWLFEGTIRENIVFNKQDVPDEEVIKVCKTVGLHHLISTLPEGYNTVLNDKSSFSEGEKQLLTIARAIIQNTPLLILDEATSSVDTRTERMVQHAMDELTKGRTSFVIAHRLSTIVNADLILVMKDGDIIENGTHEALLEQNGFYAQLYNSQFETYD